MDILLLSATLIASLFFLVKASEHAVKSSVNIAKILSVSELVIGLTIIAVGTSLPEIISGIFSALRGNGELIIGNVVGANMSNLTLVLGTGLLFSTIAVNKLLIKRDITIMAFAITLLMSVMSIGFTVSWIDGVALLLLFTAYVSFLFFTKKERKNENDFIDFINYFITARYLHQVMNGSAITVRKGSTGKSIKKELFREFFILAVSLIVVFISADFMVNSAIKIATNLNVSAAFIGAILAIGTTLPELSVTVSAAKQNKGGLLLGNIFGSCITNSFFVVGVAAIAREFSVSSSLIIKSAIAFLLMLLISIMIFIKRKLSRKHVLILYSTYVLFLLLFAGV
ncbi:MAG: sodium:calcium antiporter [Candidatus Diapherotrites archaeon]|nr:sodium:calcium antiporter [Candidatus Diapherotrites archaeon]